ncbi:GIY-YIG nuclease family protein [Xanthomonas hortorum pv. gardneri]|uniref:GIY-YIG nuclease family protein n=1 Tax=Xanthomonas hortorum TaxID=56454 RepID=UPI001E332AB4|nr:GIY-YIG nuclease family protein [Xanthomonas hortorum]MCC8494005.1 GIY-YIG nuclease family protein [Xanthomonas hortorum pv. gardneri]MCE4529198.1 GIY-YIG nuclease family protein [Xanthomonas hortorum pv. vitians]
MRLYDLINLYEPSFKPQITKVHLARSHGRDRPMDVWLNGKFDEWQCWQRKRRNFERDLVLALVQVPDTYRWMFAGLFWSRGSLPEHDHEGTLHYAYELERIPSTLSLEGRLFVTGKYVSRTSYLKGETLSEDMVVHELLAEKLGDGEFPGFNQVDIPKDTLDRIVASGNNSWRAALSSVKGIYLLTDSKTSMLYVGKADGEAGIWGRWCQYSSTGHGWNKALVQEFGIKANDRQKDLRFSILEIMDRRSQEEQIEKRESHWKRILMSRSGFNRN